LYFHAYLWFNLIQSLYSKANPGSEDFDTKVLSKNIQVFRLKGLSESIIKVEANLAKFPFNQEIYQRMVRDFAGRKPVKRTKLLEEIQRALFVAQISDNRDALAWIEKLLI
jgi:hypothetical protein